LRRVRSEYIVNAETRQVIATEVYEVPLKVAKFVLVPLVPEPKGEEDYTVAAQCDPASALEKLKDVQFVKYEIDDENCVAYVYVTYTNKPDESQGQSG